MSDILEIEEERGKMFRFIIVPYPITRKFFKWTRERSWRNLRV